MNLLQRHYFRLLLKNQKSEREGWRRHVMTSTIWSEGNTIAVARFSEHSFVYYAVFAVSERQRFVRIISEWRTRSAAIASAERIVRIRYRRLIAVQS